jgi:rubrerythrin
MKEANMVAVQNKTLDIFCEALALKERKKSLYDEAMESCPDAVGKETFRLLKAAEDAHLGHLTAVYEEVKKGKLAVDACQFHEFKADEKKTFLRRIAEERGRIRKACLDDVTAIETGLMLENEAIELFDKHLAGAADPTEREFLERMIAEERQHHWLLADLKFYYEDTENWFLEKGHQVLDGAGAGT